MRYAALGTAGASVSAVALGTMTFGRESDEEQSRAQLDEFVEAGGTLVDTADAYGAGASEEIIGRWLVGKDGAVAEDLVVATKARFPTGPGPNRLGLSRKHLAAALDASLRRLGVETIDLYQLHAWDPHTPVEETLRFVDDAVSAGKVHYLGLSNVTGWQLQRFATTAELLRLAPPVAVQPQYNLLAREVEWEVLPAAAANGLAVLPWSPLGGGWLTGKYTREAGRSVEGRLAGAPGAMNGFDRRAADERTWAVLDALRRIADERGEPPSRIALSWLLGRAGVTSVVLGARTVEHLRDNLAALDIELDGEEREALDEASRLPVADYPYGELGNEQRTRRLEGGR